MTATMRTATCCCGRCTIEVAGEPAINGICHCRNCQKRTGSAFGWSAYFVDDQVRCSDGDFGVYEIGEPNPQTRRFCRHCGNTLYWTAAFLPGHTGIADGCFADDPLASPSLTVGNDSRCAWLTLPDDWRRSL